MKDRSGGVENCMILWDQALPSILPLTPQILTNLFSPQGVEFFDEKLNSLCMAWLVDRSDKE